MRRPLLILARPLATLLAVGSCCVLPAAPAAAMPVFDATNYAQNLLQAARALEQINQQIQSLQNEATMLQNMARNLERIDFPQLERVTSALRRVETLMGEARDIDFGVDQLDERLWATFPGDLLRGDDRVVAARSRVDGALAGFRQSMRVQSQIVANVQEDAALLAELAERSQGAVGSLQVGQATNQLLALGAKQQLQLQSLLAAGMRSEEYERARRTQAEAEGRAATRRFLGSPRAYTPE